MAKLASSEVRNRVAQATSSGSLIYPCRAAKLVSEAATYQRGELGHVTGARKSGNEVRTEGAVADAFVSELHCNCSSAEPEERMHDRCFGA